MLRCLCGSPSIPLSFNLAAVLLRRDTYRVSYDTGGVDTANIKYPSFRAWTTRVSNPVCSPRFRVSVSVASQQVAFASGVPPNLYAFYRYTRNSTCLSRTLVTQFLVQSSQLSHGLSHQTCASTYTPFTPSYSG